MTKSTVAGYQKRANTLI